MESHGGTEGVEILGEEQKQRARVLLHPVTGRGIL
jgi:hypothetical protein